MSGVCCFLKNVDWQAPTQRRNLAICADRQLSLLTLGSPGTGMGRSWGPPQWTASFSPYETTRAPACCLWRTTVNESEQNPAALGICQQSPSIVNERARPREEFLSSIFFGSISLALRFWSLLVSQRGTDDTCNYTKQLHGLFFSTTMENKVLPLQQHPNCISLRKVNSV